MFSPTRCALLCISGLNNCVPVRAWRRDVPFTRYRIGWCTECQWCRGSPSRDRFRESGALEGWQRWTSSASSTSRNPSRRPSVVPLSQGSRRALGLRGCTDVITVWSQVEAAPPSLTHRTKRSFGASKKADRLLHTRVPSATTCTSLVNRASSG